MIYARFEDPPENVQAEANALFEEYMKQFDDELPEDVNISDGFRKVIFERGSKELREHILKIEKASEIAKQEGIQI